MKKTLSALLVGLLFLLNSPPVAFSLEQSNPFTDPQCKYYVWDDLSLQSNRALTIPAQNTSNGDIYYSSGSNYSYSYSGQQLRITAANGFRSTLFTTGKTADKLSTRGAVGYGCYIFNNTSSSMQFYPVIVGNDYYTAKANSPAYLINNNAASAVNTSSDGYITIPAGFNGHIAVPFSSMAPQWGYVTSFVPGEAEISYFTLNTQANVSGGSYIAFDNMFLYGGNTSYKQELITGQAGQKGSEHCTDPFALQYRFNIFESFSQCADMTIPLPESGSNTYIKSIYGAGTQQYAYKDQQFRITQANGWKYVQTNSGGILTQSQSQGVEGLGFYINNRCGKSITIEPAFTGASVYRPKTYANVRLVDMDGYSYEDTTSSWAGVISIPADFEGYVLLPVESIALDQGGFTPGTSYIEGFSFNVYASFPQSGGRFIAFDNAFAYGAELAHWQAGAGDILLPPSQSEPEQPSGQTAADIPSQGYTSGNIVGIDQFGRSFTTSTGTDNQKQVGMFFWLWTGQPTTDDIYDMTEFMKTTQGANELFSINSQTAPVNQAYFWGEPLFGYYNSADEYVLRKQAEMLTLANIDFVAFDATNTLTYPNVYMKFFKILDEYRLDGWNVPKIAFYTHSRSIQTTEKLYNDIYKKGYYSDLWYYYRGKPMIIAYTDIPDDFKEAISRNDFEYYPAEQPQEILDFFTFKYPQWPDEGVNHGEGVPYVEWEYPQPMHNGLMNVSVASQHYACMSNSYTHPGVTCWGRGFDFTTGTNISADADKGTFYQSQWNQVHHNDPDMVFIDGWNEWIGYKIDYHGQIVFVDAFTKEYSRDIEPMKGGYGDAFYLQTIDNIRKYKEYTGKDYLPSAKEISITGSLSQWDSGVKLYRAFDKDGYARDAYDAAGKNKYTTPAPRNNIQQVRVTNDVNNVYFYIQCSENITPYDNGINWMNILIGTGEPSLTGFRGYKYVVNRSVNLANGTTSIHSLNSDFSGSAAGQGNISVQGRVMQVSIPRSVLGIYNGRNDGAAIYFKVADNVQNPNNIENYYISGKSVPMGSLSFAYDGVAPQQSQSTVLNAFDPGVGIQIYEDFSSRGNTVLTDAASQYLWQNPGSGWRMEYDNQRLAVTQAPSSESSFMAYLSSSTSSDEEAIRGMQGVGFYIKNNTPGVVTLSPFEVGNHAFYVDTGKKARLTAIGGATWEIADSGLYGSNAGSFDIPAGFEGYIMFSCSDFHCAWHSGCEFTAGNAVISYFSLMIKIHNGCNGSVGQSVIFDNLFMYGTSMTSYKEQLIKPSDNPATSTDYGLQYVSNLGGKNGAWITDSSNGSTLYYTIVQDGRKAEITGGGKYNMVALNLLPNNAAFDCSAAEGLGFYVKNTTNHALEFQPVIPNNSYSLLRSQTDYYLMDMQKNLIYCQSTHNPNGGGNIKVPAGFEGYVLTKLTAYGNWWYGSNGTPFINTALRQFGFRGTMDISGGSLILSDVFIYGKQLQNTNNVVDILPSQRQYAYANGDTKNYSFTENERLQPFWQSNVIRNECVTFTQQGSTISARLLFEPDNIISLRDWSLNTEYVRGVDWEYDAAGKRLIRLAGSSIPYFTQAQLTGSGHNDNCGATGQIGNALYCVGPNLYSKQLCISYSYDYKKYNVPSAHFNALTLSKTLQKLSQGQNVSITFYGDSIMEGCDASSRYYRGPYQPTFDMLIKQGLEDKYASSVTVRNASVGGYSSAQGAGAAGTLLQGGTPDLVVIGFGQNDALLTPQQTKQNIQSIINSVLAVNPNAEFIVLSTINANYAAGFVHNQYNQSVELAGLASESIAYVDMNALHSYCMLRKNYTDLTGNNINHPNDFFIRAYAANILSVLIEY